MPDTYKDLPLTTIMTRPSTINKTGFWRALRPVLDPSKCIKCWICWKVCPDTAIDLDDDLEDYPKVNYEFCKGCGICAYECPAKEKAITMELETDYPDRHK